LPGGIGPKLSGHDAPFAKGDLLRFLIADSLAVKPDGDTLSEGLLINSAFA
jgi:hypothetical protein